MRGRAGLLLFATPAAGFFSPDVGRTRRLLSTHQPAVSAPGDLVALSSALVKAEASALGIAKLCDLEAELVAAADGREACWSNEVGLGLVRLARRNRLDRLLQRDQGEYLETVTFLGARLPRSELPNRQGLSVAAGGSAAVATRAADPPGASELDVALVPDCELGNVTVAPSFLDEAILKIFRFKVQEEIQYVSPQSGLLGLLDEGRTFMLRPGVAPSDQHQMLKNTLSWFMTPVLPPFYRLFMSGLVPSAERGDPPWLVRGVQALRARLPEALASELKPGRQLGPWFYAPALTSFVTPTFFQFLVGPSTVNRRADGALGGLVVEKCAFLQESGCKGMCLNICKVPTQDFFADTLGMPLTVTPNFETQECQWSFGEVPTPLKEDPAWPKGCLVGCPTRAEVRDRRMELTCE